jgi:hypothetical protein
MDKLRQEKDYISWHPAFVEAIQLELEALSSGVKSLGCKVKHSPPSRATLYLLCPLYAFTVQTGTA